MFNLYSCTMLPPWMRLEGDQAGRGELEEDHGLEGMLPLNDLWRPNCCRHVIEEEGLCTTLVDFVGPVYGGVRGG